MTLLEKPKVFSVYNCPICKKETVYKYKHATFKTDINFCKDCDYHFETSNIGASSEYIYKQQFENSNNFGANKQRNLKYLNILKKISESHSINSVLEIGTPKDFHFLKSIRIAMTDKKLYSYDIIKNVLPEYINPISSKEDLYKENIDLLFCIHTLEHIPVDEMIDFAALCHLASRHYIFEIPCCESEARIVRSSTEPHYSFFSETSIRKIFKNKIFLSKNETTMSFSNIRIENYT